MRILRFSFKTEAIWMMIFSLGVPMIGVLMFVAVWLIRVVF